MKRNLNPTTATDSYSLESLSRYRPCCWINAAQPSSVLDDLPLRRADLDRALARWTRLRPTLAQLFPAQVGAQGVISSPLRKATNRFRDLLGLPPSCTLLLKEDSKLAVCGSVKARGGLYETFAFAESVARKDHRDEEDDSGATLLEAIRAGRMQQQIIYHNPKLFN